MKVKFNRWYNTILTALLSLLGYGCSSENGMEMYGSPAVEYGVPTARYEIRGVVTDEAGTPVKGIKTSLKYVHRRESNEVDTHGIDSVQTDEVGHYAIKFAGIPQRNDVKLLVEDIDGEANGAFQNDTLDVAYDKAVKTADGKSTWDVGTYSINQDIKLKKK